MVIYTLYTQAQGAPQYPNHLKMRVSAEIKSDLGEVGQKAADYGPFVYFNKTHLILCFKLLFTGEMHHIKLVVCDYQSLYYRQNIKVGRFLITP